MYEECGWCEKDGGFAVGYTKEEEIVGDTHRTTMTLGKECKGKLEVSSSSFQLCIHQSIVYWMWCLPT